MDFKALTTEERLALAALTRTMVRLDKSYSREESERLGAIATELGAPEAFWEAMELAEQTVDDPEKLRAVSAAVTRPEARQLILEVLEGVAAAAAGSEPEQTMLDELRALWEGRSSVPPYRA